MKHHSFKGEYLLDNFHNCENGMYQMKNFLEFITIIPSYFLGAIGKPIYKKDSFDLVKPLVPLNNWEIVNKATRIRLLWPEKEKHPYTSNRIPNWLKDELGKDYFYRAYKLISSLCDKLDDYSTESQ